MTFSNKSLEQEENVNTLFHTHTVDNQMKIFPTCFTNYCYQYKYHLGKLFPLNKEDSAKYTHNFDKPHTVATF